MIPLKEREAPETAKTNRDLAFAVVTGGLVVGLARALSKHFTGCTGTLLSRSMGFQSAVHFRGSRGPEVKFTSTTEPHNNFESVDVQYVSTNFWEPRSRQATTLSG